MDHAKAIDDLIVQLGGSYANAGFRGFGSGSATGDLATLQDRNVFLTSSVLGMKAISHVIEDRAISLNKPINFYATFQKLSRARYQERRYTQLLDTGSTVHILAESDIPLHSPVWQRPNAKMISLPSTSDTTQPHLNANWMVVLHDPSFVSMALVSREIPNPTRPSNAPDKLVYRAFEGFWTYDKDVIAYVAHVLDDYITTAVSV